jgi:hypothetical protein
MPLSRRDLLLSLGAAPLSSPRRYHLSISHEAIESDPAVVELARDAGVRTIWLASFLYGYWYSPPEEVRKMRERIVRLGLSAEVINVPLGHPGDSLGAMNGNVPLGPPGRWKLAVGLDGREHKNSWGVGSPPCRRASKLRGYGER